MPTRIPRRGPDVVGAPTRLYVNPSACIQHARALPPYTGGAAAGGPLARGERLPPSATRQVAFQIPLPSGGDLGPRDT